MQEPVGQKLPEKRKLPFQAEMLMDFPDVGSLQPSFLTPEEKHVQWLYNLEEKHRIQRMRLRNRHIQEYQKWKEEVRLSIDPEVLLPYNSTTAPKEQIHESSLPILTSQAATEALKRQGKEYRHVLIGMEQLEDSREEGEIVGSSLKASSYSNVELAAEVGRMGVNLRKRMVDEKIEMRIFQASEKEMVQSFLLKSDPDKYGRGKARGSVSGSGSGGGGGGGGGGVGVASGSTGPSFRPPQGPKAMLAQANAGIGGVGLAGLFRQNAVEDKTKPKAPLNIKIPPPPPGPRPPGTGSRTSTPLTAASTATVTGDGYFSGLPSAGLTRDPRLPPKPETPKDPRLAANSPTFYRNMSDAGGNTAGGGGGVADGTAAIAGKNTYNTTAPTNTSGKPPILPAFQHPSSASPYIPLHSSSPTASFHAPDGHRYPTAMPSEHMPPPPFLPGMAPVTSIASTIAQTPNQYVAPMVPGMSPVTSVFHPPVATVAPGQGSASKQMGNTGGGLT